MHPLTALDLVAQYHHEFRAAAARHRLATEARRIRRPTPLPSPPASQRDDSLAERLATFGPSTLTIELHRFARDARRSGACPLLLDVLTDGAQPDVARLRAFGRIMADLHRPPERPAATRSSNAA